MAKSSNEITQGLFEAVDTIIGERISALPYDQTIVCQIVNTQDHANGIYTVTHNYNTTFTAYADFTGYNVNDYVYVRIPEGDYTQQKVITGKFLEGMIISGETQNIAVTPVSSFLLYNKDNQINQYSWSKTEREIVFTYFNSTNLEETWDDVISQYSGDDMNYERPKAIKIIVNSEKDIVIYLYKYTNDNGASFHFAAEQYGITSPTFMQTVENKPNYINVTTYIEVPKNAEFDNTKVYYTKIGQRYNIANITSFNESITYYTMQINSKVPNGTQLYQFIDNSYEPIPMELVETTEEDQTIKTYVYYYNEAYPIYYYNTGYLEVKIPSSIKMLSSMKVYYNNNDTGSIHILYTIAPELDPEQIQIPITVSYCPIDEYYNVSQTLSLSFGYITELNDEINFSLQLIHKYEDSEEIVPAVTLGDTTGVYNLQLLLIDKFGNKLSPNLFSYKWNNTNSENSSSYQINNITSIPTEGIVYKLDIGFQNGNNFDIYKTLYYPLAIRKEELLYIEGPDIIIYNEAGVKPKYFDGLITLKKYNNSQFSYELQAEENNTLFKIQNNILNVYNIFSSEKASYFIAKEGNDILWFQSLYFLQKKSNSYNLVKKLPGDNLFGSRSNGALAAQSGQAAGAIIRYDNNILSIEGYDLTKTPNKIFHLGSDGTLSVGYDSFTMTGHITQGARYLESGFNNKYNVGSNKTPIYFENGIPKTMPQLLETNQNKVIPNYNTSVITTYNNNQNLSNYNGRLITCASNITIDLSNGSGAPEGFECEVYKSTNNENVKITFIGNKLYSIDTPSGVTSLQLTEPRGVVAIKKIANGHWLLTGSVEEAT